MIIGLTRLQEAVAVRNKIEDLLSRVAALETLFATRPSDVEEQRHRIELIRYATPLTLNSVLSSSQQA
jgi:hypothetical protein